MTKPRPISEDDVINIRIAIAHAKQARALLRAAGAHKAAAKVAATLKSLQGAFIHARDTRRHRALLALRTAIA